jgi:hypothetical protein
MVVVIVVVVAVIVVTHGQSPNGFGWARTVEVNPARS